MNVRGLVALVTLAALLPAGCGDTSSRQESGAASEIAVAAASDLRFAFGALAETFTERTGTRVVFSFGSSGQLAQQIENGAPFDLFASANVDYVDAVIEAGRGDPATKATYAVGRLVIWSRTTSYPNLAGLAATGARTIAIANPEHAPYGLAARQALERAGVYPAVKPKLVFGENVSDTLRLAESGNADAAIVALSLALVREGKWTPIPAELHDALEQSLVVTGRGARADAAAAFAAHVGSAEGRAVMRRFGFLLPDERPEG